MEEKKAYRKEHKDFHSKGNSFSRKNQGNRGSFAGRKTDGRNGGFKKRRLEVGSDYQDRELGKGVVKALSEESITVQFGEVEKVILRRKRTERREEAKPFVKREYAKDDRNPVFKFDRTEDRSTERKPGEGRSPVKVGLHVVDDVLGSGVVGRITERGTYVTYDRTGEHVLYPSGLPAKLLKSAFPDSYVKEKKSVKPSGGVSRIYKVPQQETVKEEKAVSVQSSSDRTDRVPTNYIEIGEGTAVGNKEYGEGVIVAVEEHHFLVDFEGEKIEFPYPESLMDGRLYVMEK